MNNYSFHFNLTQTFSTLPSSIDILIKWVSYNIIYPIEAYILPVFVVLAIGNNILVLIVFITSKDVTKHTKQSIRIYYIATAIGDIFASIPFHLTYFLGTNAFRFRIEHQKANPIYS